MRILVLGGTRFIGPSVVARLAGAGHDLTVLHRGRSEAPLPAGVRHLHADRRRILTMREELHALRPDVVVDMVPFSERDALELLLALRGTAGRLVAVSSQDVYRAYGRLHRSEDGAAEAGPLTEGAPLRERLYPYRGDGRGLDDYEKILVERIVLHDPALPGTVLRLPMVYGERDYQRRLAFELKRMDDRRPAIFLEETFARWRWTRGYVENVAAAIALATVHSRAAGGVYNAGAPDALSYADWLRVVGEAAGWTGEVVIVPDGRLSPSLRPPDGDYTQHLVADTSKIRSELGYVEPVPFFQTLLRTIAWERSNRDSMPIDYAAEDALTEELRAATAWAPQQTPP